jgi:hypothetical protein
LLALHVHFSSLAAPARRCDDRRAALRGCGGTGTETAAAAINSTPDAVMDVMEIPADVMRADEAATKNPAAPCRSARQ